MDCFLCSIRWQSHWQNGPGRCLSPLVHPQGSLLTRDEVACSCLQRRFPSCRPCDNRNMRRSQGRLRLCICRSTYRDVRILHPQYQSNEQLSRAPASTCSDVHPPSDVVTAEQHKTTSITCAGLALLQFRLVFSLGFEPLATSTSFPLRHIVHETENASASQHANAKPYSLTLHTDDCHQ